MVKGKTASGYKYSINEAILKDWDFVLSLSELQSGNTSMKIANNVLTAFLTPEGFEDLKEHIRKKNDGFAPIDKIMAEFNEICSNEEIKNLLAS